MHSKWLKLRGKESIKCFKSQNTTELFPGNPCAAVFTGKCIYCKKPTKPKKRAERKKKNLYLNSHHSGSKIMFKLADLELVWKQ